MNQGPMEPSNHRGLNLSKGEQADQQGWILESSSPLKRANSFDQKERFEIKRKDSSDSSDKDQPNASLDPSTPRRAEEETVYYQSDRMLEQELAPNLGEFLKMRVAFAGQNIEKSIRKVISLARAILEKPRLILLYEEAINCGYGVAYNVDVLKARCPESTVMSITRSNRNILSYDQIILMDGGMIIDQGDPIELISQEQSHFHNYLKETDHETFLNLKRQMELKNRSQQAKAG